MDVIPLDYKPYALQRRVLNVVDLHLHRRYLERMGVTSLSVSKPQDIFLRFAYPADSAGILFLIIGHTITSARYSSGYIFLFPVQNFTQKCIL